MQSVTNDVNSKFAWLHTYMGVIELFDQHNL